MKRDKLYTINKGNKNLFADAGSLNRKDWSFVPGTYDIAASTLSSLSAAPDLTGIDLTKLRVPAAPEINNSWLGISKVSNPFSKQNIGGTLTAAAPIVGGAVGGLLSGGMSTGVGNVMSGLGKAASAIPGPYGAAISAGLQIAGGAVNGLFGEKVDQEKLARNNAGTSYLNNFSSNAATFDAVQGPQTQAAIQDAYKGGVFNKSAKRKNAAARADRLTAQKNASAQVENNVNNLVDSQMDNMLANYSAFGGALDLMQSNNYINAINNRSSAIARNNMQTYSSPSLFGPRELYKCGGQIKPNKYEFGGLEASFVDNFAKDPLAAVLDYNRGIEQRAAAKEASEAAAAQEAMINELKLGLQKAQAENEGLWAMYGDQQKTLNGLLESSRYSAPYPTTSEEGDDLISGIANSGAKVVRDVMNGNSGGADDYRNLKEFIKKHESFVPKAYQLEGEAHPTIGYGFYDVYPGTNRKVKAGDTITKAEADKYLDAAIRNLDNILAPKVPNWSKMTNNQRDAIRDLAFGTGPWGAHFKPNSRLFQALRREDWAAAEKELRSKSASLDIYNKGLAKRSDRRQAMWRAGDYSVKAFGGELGTNGSDFTNGLLEINAGGSHEDNPFEGVQLGVDQNGVPNLVEEGETVFNDYVFSKRMVVPDFMKKQLGLGSAKDDITFADASKKIAQESVERPNDPISQAGLEAGLAKLAEIQETERMRMQAEEENADMEMSMMQGLSAYGGNLFDTGGPLNGETPTEKRLRAQLAAKKKKEAEQAAARQAAAEKERQGRISRNIANKQAKTQRMQEWLYANPNLPRTKYLADMMARTGESLPSRAYAKLTAGQNDSKYEKKRKYDYLIKNGVDKEDAYRLVRGEVSDPEESLANWEYLTGNSRNAPLTIEKVGLSGAVIGRLASQLSQSANNSSNTNNNAGNKVTWGTSKSGLHTKIENGVTTYRAADGYYYPSEQAAINVNKKMGQGVQQAAPASNTQSQSPVAGTSNNRSSRASASRSSAGIVSSAPQTGATGLNLYGWYRNGSDGISEPTGFKVGDNGRAYDYTDEYRNLVGKLGANDIRKWAEDRGWKPGITDFSSITDPSLRSFLERGNKLENLKDEQWRTGALDGIYGFMHHVAQQKLNDNNPQAPVAPETPTTVQSPSTNIYHAVVGDEDYHLENELDWNKVGDEVRRETLPNGDTVIYHAGKGPGTDEAATASQQSKPSGAGSTDITEKQPKPYPTWMRYAPIVGTGIATMTDLLGLTNKPDYSYADKIEALAERAGYAPNIRAPYIGDYMRYNPLDRLFYANQLQANSRATDRGLMNTSGGNRGAAQAGMLANGYNSQLGLGNLYRQAEEYNRGQYERTKAFNRGTNQFNAQMGLEADMANARYRQMASQYQMQGLGQAAAMRQAEDARTGAARSANFTNFLNNLGNLGRENFALNQILSSRDANNGYYTDNKGIVYHNGKAYAEVKNPSAFGGEVERYLKNKKKVRRSK